MKKRFEMSENQLKTMMKAFQPVPYIVVGGYSPRSPQENANDAWKLLGEEMGFIWDTVEPSNEGDRIFFAEPIGERIVEEGK